jgi:hypothetical protein
MNEYTGTITTAGEHEIYYLRPAMAHPDAFGIPTGHPMAPAPDADAEPGAVNHHPGPDFAPREPEAGS